ncbi:MAG TPA: Asp-tRNA(Asn)/Glu-tRNA(Gln) amidotransferase subunit GatC [Candidatus Omnitrophota bacterium]|jgi:aspartyl-tRNA(Asn)/glutamyl-tRNA(Gln) amidotransferase subunit C|nr:Asp-tRNA(Asn)/Glu-tRNA(Gln) amidotransferase subunit GatC [Candidatus Omnitrophota bacterium]HPN56994.1 Asp-tRNA(Asn)/Glu-tRNA(Gln) amidotransferase subunit GatC [Candidatus Omnitrophota bacterium]
MITKNTIQTIASLARMNLPDAELTALTHDLEAILNYIAKLEKLDTSAVTPTSHVLPLQNVFREDRVVPSLTQAEAVQMAITQKDGAFTVPQVIE